MSYDNLKTVIFYTVITQFKIKLSIKDNILTLSFDSR